MGCDPNSAIFVGMISFAYHSGRSAEFSLDIFLSVNRQVNIGTSKLYKIAFCIQDEPTPKELNVCGTSLRLVIGK